MKYVSSPDDLDTIADRTREFLENHDGKLRVSLDSITEMIYYADEQRVYDAVAAILGLLEEHDAVGLFHLAEGVHDDDVVSRFRDLFDGTIELEQDGTVTAQF